MQTGTIFPSSFITRYNVKYEVEVNKNLELEESERKVIALLKSLLFVLFFLFVIFSYVYEGSLE